MVDGLNKLVVPSAGRLDLLDITSPSGITHETVWKDVSEARMDCKLSPDGKLVAFVLDGDLWCLPVGSDVPHRLTDFHRLSFADFMILLACLMMFFCVSV